MSYCEGLRFRQLGKAARKLWLPVTSRMTTHRREKPRRLYPTGGVYPLAVREDDAWQSAQKQQPMFAL